MLAVICRDLDSFEQSFYLEQLAKGKKKKGGERIKGYDCRKCHPKPGKRESTGGWRHYLNEPSSWAIARKRKGGKKGRTLHGQWPETLLSALCYIKTKKRRWGQEACVCFHVCIWRETARPMRTPDVGLAFVSSWERTASTKAKHRCVSPTTVDRSYLPRVVSTRGGGELESRRQPGWAREDSTAEKYWI